MSVPDAPSGFDSPPFDAGDYRRALGGFGTGVALSANRLVVSSELAFQTVGAFTVMMVPHYLVYDLTGGAPVLFVGQLDDPFDVGSAQ